MSKEEEKKKSEPEEVSWDSHAQAGFWIDAYSSILSLAGSWPMIGRYLVGINLKASLSSS